MKKKIILLAFALMLFAGIVSASSINGDYKGNPIVKVTSNGKLLEVDEVPGMIYDGHTVIPISLLRQIGASVTWDAYGYSVDVRLPSNNNLNYPTSSEKTTDSSIKIKVIQIDNFTIAENTAEYMQSFLNMISLYFQGSSNNFSSRYSSVDIESKFSDLTETLIKNSNLLGSFIQDNPNLDNSSLQTHIAKLNQAMDSIKFAKNNVIAWDNYKFADPRRSQTHFDTYLKYVGMAQADLDEVISTSHKEYLKVVNGILAN